jgi:hypothetical protein
MIRNLICTALLGLLVWPIHASLSWLLPLIGFAPFMAVCVFIVCLMLLLAWLYDLAEARSRASMPLDQSRDLPPASSPRSPGAGPAHLPAPRESVQRRDPAR